MNNFIIEQNWQDIPVQDWHNVYIKLLKENKQLDEALDRACEYLAEYSQRSGTDDDFDEKVYWQDYRWREFLIDNE